MKLRIPAALLVTVVLLLILAPSGRVQAQTYIQYKIQLNSDGSAAWIITQVSGINGTVDTWAGFQEKVIALVAAAATQTHRSMNIDYDTLQMSTTSASSDSKTTEYLFTWLNFSRAKNGQLTVGDVFGVAGFFDQLYGDGTLQINYPANYTLESVVPMPDEKDASTQTLQWLGTQFFVNGKPCIILEAQEQTVDTLGQQQSYVLLGSVSAVAAAAAFAGFFLANRRHKQNSKESTLVSTMNLLETEEEKIFAVLRSNDGSAYQSTIAEQCKFSKAKTSRLLSALEAKGIVQRYKKGRDKIVNLIEQAKG
jgi:uncharacterized membrane protein